jgi:hypothetical protein
VSQRHISFVESGRSKASRQLIHDWMQAVEGPDDLKAAALQQAGFAPLQNRAVLGDLAMVNLTKPMALLLDTDFPQPIFAYDEHWTMLRINAVGASVLGAIMPVYWELCDYSAEQQSMLDAFEHPDGFFRHMINAREAAASLLRDLQLSAVFNPSIAERVEQLTHALTARLRIDEQDLLRIRPLHPRRYIFETAYGRLAFYTVHLWAGYTGAGVKIGHWVASDVQTTAALQALRASSDADTRECMDDA